MENVNCLRCRFRHEDNGNCTAVGGFCTAVPAAHCPLLRQYLDTGMTPEAFQSFVVFFQDLIGNQKASEALDRFRQLVKADRDGRLVVLPCKVGGEVYSTLDDLGRLHQCRATYVLINERPYLNTVALEPVDYEGSQYGASFGAFGQTVFLTREEAEKALEAKSNA